MFKMTAQKSAEFLAIAFGSSLMFGIPAGLIGAVIAFAAWEAGAYWLTR